MAPDSFITAIRGAANEAIAQIDAETEDRVAAILGEASRKADEETNRFVSETELKATRDAQRDLNAAKVAAHRAEADVSYELYDDFFTSVAAQLVTYREDTVRYQPVLEALIAEAASGFSGGTVSVDPRDEALAGIAVARLGPTFALDTAVHCAGGCRVSNEDRTVIRDNTFETRLRRVKDEKQKEIWSVLVS